MDVSSCTTLQVIICIFHDYCHPEVTNLQLLPIESYQNILRFEVAVIYINFVKSHNELDPLVEIDEQLSYSISKFLLCTLLSERLVYFSLYPFEECTVKQHLVRIFFLDNYFLHRLCDKNPAVAMIIEKIYKMGLVHWVTCVSWVIRELHNNVQPGLIWNNYLALSALTAALNPQDLLELGRMLVEKLEHDFLIDCNCFGSIFIIIFRV